VANFALQPGVHCPELRRLDSEPQYRHFGPRVKFVGRGKAQATGSGQKAVRF
jgi:hypothetical protein